jgi:competence protein ComGE
MLSKNKGFFLLELLLSLSAWFLIGLYLLPLLIDMTNQYKQLEVNKFARQLLYEELQAKLIDGQSYASYSVFLNGIEYKINWRDSSVPGQKEVCVKVEKNSFHPNTEICGVPE